MRIDYKKKEIEDTDGKKCEIKERKHSNFLRANEERLGKKNIVLKVKNNVLMKSFEI